MKIRTILLIVSITLLFGCSIFNKPGRDVNVNVEYLLDEDDYNNFPLRTSYTRENNLLHTKLDISFDWEEQQLFGKAWLTLTPYFYPTETLTLDAKGFDIHEIKIIKNDSVSEDLSYTYDSLKLIIELDERYNRDQEFIIYIDYTANPSKLKERGLIPTRRDQGLFFVNPKNEDPLKPQQIWTQGETENSSCWFPTIDAPNERTTQETYITVDTNFTTLSNGLLIYSSLNKDGTRTDYWSMEMPHAPYLFMFTVGEFVKVQDKWLDIDVDYYVEREYEQYALDIFGNTPEMLEFYSNILGFPYPWEKFAQVVVRDFVAGAMENTSAVIFFERVQQTKREMIDGKMEGIIAHELFHHWFGDLVTCESWSNISLNESFATYGEYLWQEYKYGDDEAGLLLKGKLRSYLRESERKQV
ncbi:MAG: M1 family metallopeptidase, partial [Bacteroidetes bacterium]|nr:M1 family metallopeptidase [Bacteroidota bacterium]